MLTTNTTTILADIRAAKRAIFKANRNGIATDPCNFYWKLVPRERELQDQAAAAFARLNGWKPSASAFPLEQLAGRKPHDVMWWQDYRRDVFDHMLHFKSKRYPAAIVAQPYPGKDFGCIYEAQQIADRMGLAMHMPPAPRASIHLPGSTVFLVFTSRDHEIRWLPEMISGVPRCAAKWVRIIGRPKPDEVTA